MRIRSRKGDTIENPLQHISNPYVRWFHIEHRQTLILISSWQVTFLKLKKCLGRFYVSLYISLDEADPSPTENLGQVLFGERIRPSPYKFEFNKNETCKEVCTKKYTEDNDEMKFLKHGMMFSVIYLTF